MVLQISPQCPVHGSSQTRPSVHAVDRLIDVFENEEWFLVSERFSFAQYGLASNPKTVMPEVSKPALWLPSFQSQVATEKGPRELNASQWIDGGISEDRKFQSLSRTACSIGPFVNLLCEPSCCLALCDWNDFLLDTCRGFVGHNHFLEASQFEK